MVRFDEIQALLKRYHFSIDVVSTKFLRATINFRKQQFLAANSEIAEIEKTVWNPFVKTLTCWALPGTESCPL